MASGPEGTEPLKHQTSVLKVSIHCEGCKKKVRKILRGLEGVYTIDINSKQNKVTVTGIVDAESLIRRLVKYGKHAELWPEENPIASNSSGEAAGDAKPKTDAAATARKTEQNLPNTENQQQTEEGKSKTNSVPPAELTAISPAAAAAISFEVSASKANIDASKSNDDDTSAKSEKKDSDKPATAAETNISREAGDLKKGETVQREKSSIDERAVTDSNTVVNSAGGGGVTPPPLEQFPLYYQPVYSLNYSAVQPSTSHAYYAPSPAAMPSSYSYSGYPPPSTYSPENYSSDPYYGSMEPPPASGGSYDMFNDENPNACNLM